MNVTGIGRNVTFEDVMAVPTLRLAATGIATRASPTPCDPTSDWCPHKQLAVYGRNPGCPRSGRCPAMILELHAGGLDV